MTEPQPQTKDPGPDPLDHADQTLQEVRVIIEKVIRELIELQIHLEIPK